MIKTSLLSIESLGKLLDRELAKKVFDSVEDPHIETVKKFGMACSLPGSLQGSLHAFLKHSQNAERYMGTIRDIIRAGGCNCSRDYKIYNIKVDFFCRCSAEDYNFYFIHWTYQILNQF